LITKDIWLKLLQCPMVPLYRTYTSSRESHCPGHIHVSDDVYGIFIHKFFSVIQRCQILLKSLMTPNTGGRQVAQKSPDFCSKAVAGETKSSKAPKPNFREPSRAKSSPIGTNRPIWQPWCNLTVFLLWLFDVMKGTRLKLIKVRFF